MSQYSYSPLQAGQNRIRLLRLLPAEADEAEIQCELFDYSLDDSRRNHLYEALSYVWGDPKNTLPVLMHGQRFEVTVNLHAALLRLRNHAMQRILWVDAICINQVDQKEKEHQIQAMAKIYGQANRVVVWLGEAADGSDEAIEQLRVTGDNTPSAPIRERGPISGPTLALLQRPWFRRIWVLQEVGVARHVLIVCGSAEVDGYAFCSSIRSFGRTVIQPLIISVTYLMMGAIFEPKGPYQRSHRICTLGELLDMYHSHEVSLQHDKVYALLGLCSDDISETGLLPNYNTRWNDILETLVRFLLYKEIHIERSPNIERTLIKGTAYVLGSISSLHLYSTSDGREGVEVKWRTMKDTTEDSWTRRSDWALRPSAKPVMVGDVICLFHGASKPIIIRICEDHCFIIQIAPTPPPDVRIKGEDVKWLNFEQMARRFPVRYLQCVWDWGTLPEISQTQGDVEQSRIDLPRMIGIWNSMRILEEAGAPREAEILFRKLMRTYEESTGQDGLRDTIANHLCRMTDVDMCYINKSYDLAPLSWAADEGYMAVVDLLVKHDEASIDFVGGWGYTPLICAARSDHLDVVERLLRENLEINRSTAIVGPVAMKITALQAAAERGHFTIVERLLQAGADVNAEASPDEGRTALQAASEGGHIEIVERLLKEKADINAAAIDHRGITALQAAAAQGHLTIVERLLQAGADVNSKAAKLGGRTALQAASEGGYTTIVERLLKARAYVNAAAAEREGTTALHAAVKAGHITIVDRLLQEGADVNAVGLHGWRVLHQAACKGHFIVLVRLLEAQPDVHAIDKNEKTALHLAAESGHLEIVERLLQEGADVNAAAYNDSTALWIATRRGHLDIVERLRQAGAKE